MYEEVHGQNDLLTCSRLPFTSVDVVERDIPEEFMELANAKRAELFEHLAEVDEAMSDMFIMEENPTSEQLSVRQPLPSFRRHRQAYYKWIRPLMPNFVDI
jgi:hypothetical protein